MPRIINLLLLVIGIVIAGVGLAVTWKPSGSPTILVVGICVMGIALISDYRRSKNAETQRRAESEIRISALTSAPWHAGQRLVVRGSIGLFLGQSAVTLIFLALIYSELNEPAGTEYRIVILALALLPVLLIGLVRASTELFKPALQLSAQGIDTAIHGRIPWSEITGVDLKKQNYRGHINYFLHFRVEQYRRVIKNAHWTEHVLGVFGAGAMRRGYITIRLKDKHEQPETINAVARFLWKQATNSDYIWSPLMSNAANAAARNVGRTLASHQDMERLYQRMKSEPQKVMDEIHQMEKELSIIRKEGIQWFAQTPWITAVLIVLLLVSIFWPLLKRL